MQEPFGVGSRYGLLYCDIMHVVIQNEFLK